MSSSSPPRLRLQLRLAAAAEKDAAEEATPPEVIPYTLRLPSNSLIPKGIWEGHHPQIPLAAFHACGLEPELAPEPEPELALAASPQAPE